MVKIKNLIWPIVCFYFTLFGCKMENQAGVTNSFAPKIVEAKGYVVPQSDMVTPVVIDVRNVKSIPAGNPKIIHLKSNNFPAGDIPVVELGVPTNIIPGQDGFKLPNVVPVKDSSFVAGLPEIVEVKNPQIIDNNQISFSVLNTLQGLKSNLISSLFQDKAGNIWIGTYGGGLTKYDGRYFSHYTVLQGLNNNDIRCLIQDKGGNLWIGTGNGVHKFDGKFITIFTVRQGLCSNSVWGLLEDKNGNIWINTTKGLTKYDGKTFTNYTDEQGFSKRKEDKFVEDKNGAFWFDCQNGFCKFDEKSFTYYPSSGATWTDFLATFGKNIFDGNSILKFSAIGELNSLSDNRIFSGANGKVWFITEKGLAKYEDNSISLLGLENGFNGANLQNIIEDRSGNLWIGSNGGGVAKINSQLFTHLRASDGLSKESIRSILADKKGNIWVGTWAGGINKFDGKSITQYTTANGLSNNNIQAICEDKNGNIWLGTWGSGISKFDGKTFTNYTQVQGLINGYITCIIEDSQSNLWFGTGGSGAIKYDGKNFENFSIGQELIGARINSILEDSGKNIWFGTTGIGVYKYDGKSLTHFDKRNGLSDSFIMDMLEDSKGNIWFGTTFGGVDKFDGKSFTQYTTEQGLPNNSVNSILEDNDGNIWFGTSFGLSRLRFGRKEYAPAHEGEKKVDEKQLFKNYLYSDGFTGVGTWYNSLALANNGIIWAGATDRISAYHKEEDVTDTIPPTIQLCEISLFNENINWLQIAENNDKTIVLQNGVAIKNFGFSGIANWTYIPENLNLTYDNNFITFKFIGITTNRPDRVKYSYILEGLDKSWSSPSTKPEATYTNLFHGYYTFRVKAMNSEGFWSNELSYNFVIKPPWWFRWWAYCIYALILILCIWLVHLYQKRRYINIEKVKAQKKELEQAREIEKAYTELKSTQAQLIQSEKMANLGQLTAGIAHEIQNPLNFVNNFSEVSNELIVEMKEELAAGNMQLANEIADDIKQNLEKINHHGKRAADIVKGMLQHSRTSTGQKEPTDINKLADEYLRLAYHGLRAKDKSFNADFKTDFDPNLSKINVIPQDIGRVLLNLINNAFYACTEQSKLFQSSELWKSYQPLVSVSTINLGDKIQISVKDNGPGIPLEIKNKIFQPFFTTKPTGQGTGLGLSLSYDIVKAHGGELRVETKEGEGTEFIIELPLNNT
jgi:signal transduction histidine kinase/ligand-binding sensor domain-containing protein